MIAIIKAKRSAIGKYNGMYKDTKIIELGSELIKSLIKDIKIDEVIIGNVLSSGHGQNIARQIAINSGIDVDIPAYTINMVCGSSLKAIWSASQSIISGDNKIVLAGGIEKMTDSQNMIIDGLTDAFSNNHMGITAENICEKYNITRKELDDFAYLSQQRAKNAIINNIFSDEIYDDKIDEYPRLNLEREKLDELKPVFKENGKITAGNSSGINDGASFLILSDINYAKEMNYDVLAYIKGFSSSGCDPQYMGIAPIYSTKKLLKKFNLSVDDIDLFEINEAFSAVVLAFSKELNVPLEKININGGGISLGHPIGTSGARILTTLIYNLKRNKLKRGIATLCIGGGQGISVLIEVL